MLQIRPDRYYAWKQRADRGCPEEVADPLSDRAPGPGPGEAPHRLLEVERQQISSLLKEERYADLSPRQLSVVASESQVVQASASSFYRQARREKLLRQREVKTPVRPEKPKVNPSGPNQVWSWDITYLPLGFIFAYLVAILDVHSRKIVGWRLCLSATVEQIKMAWDLALGNEGLLGMEGPRGLEALSDHGSQMTAKSMAEFFKDLGIPQLFARYRTPTDNAWIESWFRIIKYDFLRYHVVTGFLHLEELIAQFVDYYNHHRNHGAIGFVTPHQKHTGQDQSILEARRQRKEEARRRRLNAHRQLASQSTHQAA
jgi:putative transposase